MPRLNQIIAIEKGVKARSHQRLTEAHHALQKPALLSGISRTYRSKDEEGEQLPPEATRVQAKAEDIIRSTVDILGELFDVTATKDYANCKARADVVVDGKVLLTGAPVTYLLFLEKQLVDMNTFIKKLPVLDASESWTFDPPRTPGRRSRCRRRDQEDPTQPRQGRGDGQTPGAGGGLSRGRGRRLLEDGQVLGRAAGAAHQRAARSGGEAAKGGQVRPRGGEQPGGRGAEGRRRRPRVPASGRARRAPDGRRPRLRRGRRSDIVAAECKSKLKLSLMGSAPKRRFESCPRHLIFSRGGVAQLGRGSAGPPMVSSSHPGSSIRRRSPNRTGGGSNRRMLVHLQLGQPAPR